MTRRILVFLAAPPLLALTGAMWMLAAAEHFEKQTGRAFYGLAGNHYSVPEWGFAYHDGGKHIERWTVSVPPKATLAALFASAVTFTIGRRRDGMLQIAVVWTYHGLMVAAFALVAAWFWIHVMGVFI
jgi:hypothetical protein